MMYTTEQVLRRQVSEPEQQLDPTRVALLKKLNELEYEIDAKKEDIKCIKKVLELFPDFSHGDD